MPAFPAVRTLADVDQDAHVEVYDDAARRLVAPYATE